MSEFLMWLGDILIGVGIVLLVGSFFFYLWLRKLNTKLEAKLKELGDNLESRFIPLDIELDNGMYFCYNARDNSFVCQGRTALEIRETFQSRFPNCIAFLNNENDGNIQQLKQEFLELKASETSNSQ